MTRKIHKIHEDTLFAKTRKLRMATIDIETSKIKCYSYHAFNLVMPKDIYEHGHFLSYAYRFLGDKKPVYKKALTDFKQHFKKNPKCDYELVKEIGELLNTCDVVITQNGEHFDLPYINTRLMYHQLPPVKKIVSTDTKKLMRAFYLQSKALDYMGSFLGLGEKTKFLDKDGTWVLATEGDKKAIKTIKDYNGHDIELTEKLLLRIAPYVDVKWNMNLLKGTVDCCPTCGSSSLTKRGSYMTKVGKRTQLQCQECGSWCNSRQSKATTKYTK